jgi:DNA polymerase (family X)
MANEQLASILREMAFFAELQGENPFKIRAWQKSADLLEEQADEAAELVSSGQIAKIPGIGKGTQALVEEFVKSGSVGECESLKAKFPPYILELTEVRGLGPKKIKALYEQLGVGSLTELEYACEENRLLGLKGFGEKTQSGILENIAKVKANRGRAILPMALQQADEVREELRALPGVERVEASGELRRLLPVQARLDFVLAGDRAAASLAQAGFTEAEKGSWRRTAPDRLMVYAHLASKEDFGTRLLETTGPEPFVCGLGKLAPAPEEREVFAAKSIELLPPESRDLGAAPAKLVEEKDIKGVFHLHTNWSDGKNTLEEMAAAALELGLEYLGVSDHSQTAIYAHGLDGKRLLEQRKEIDRVQEKFPSLRIFHGIESDILPDGSLDYPDELLKKLDFVIASVHGQMRMKPEEMTKRLCRVLEHPATTWLGHWTGRLLLGREGFQFDQEQVLEAAAKHGKGIELNSNPYRLDLDWSVAPEAARLGIPIGVFPDAHSAGGLADVRFGVWMARKAGLTAGQVVNTKSRKEMEAWLAERKFR